MWLLLAQRKEKRKFLRDIRVTNLGFAGEQKHIDQALKEFDDP